MTLAFDYQSFLIFLSSETTVLVLVFLIFLGGACSEINFFSFSLTFSIIFFAFGAKGMLVLSEIWMSSTDIIGGRSIGFFLQGTVNS